MKVLDIISEDAYEHNKTHEVYWRSLKPAQQAEWQNRRVQLEGRARKIYNRLASVMPPEDRSSIKGVPVNVPLHGEMAWAAANDETKIITVDLGAFWDLPDDCLGFVLGHEIGHFVYYRNNPNWWRKRIPPELNRKMEMDADVYGAILAYRLGYDPRKAWLHFTRAEREEAVDAKSRYPSVRQRQSNVAAAIKKDKDERAAAKAAASVPADQQGQQGKQPSPSEPPISDLSQASPATTEPEEMQEPPMSSAAQTDIDHAKHGIEGLLANLNKDPQIAVHMFPGTGGGNTAYA
jgi:hypothetical protein